MTRIYIDTSAYLALLLGEEKGEELRQILKNALLCSSSFLFLEAERNLIHLVRVRILDEPSYEKAYSKLQGAMEGFLLRDFTRDLCLSHDFPAIKTPKSADLLHLRTALWFQRNGGLSKFISVDKHQTAAARELGLPV